MANFYTIKDNFLVLRLCISPSAKKNKIAGLYGERLKISLAAPPVDGKANKCLIEFLSEILGCSKSDIEIYKGESSKLKTINIRASEPQKILVNLNKLLK